MDYAAALRASPAGPAVRLDTTPVAKAQPQKAPSPKPAKVEAEETVHIIEEETVPTASIASVPAKPPSNAGLSPIVRFVLRVPAAAPSDKEAHSTSTDANAESSDSDSETEEDAAVAAGANGAKSKNSSTEAKAPVFSAQDLDNNHMRQSDLVALLEKNAEDRAWELDGGFRFSKGSKGSGKSSSSAIHDLDLSTVTLSLKWLSAIIELLRSKTSTNIAAGGGSFISIARVENQIRVIRINGGQASKELWLAFDDVVLDVREQAKLYLKVANRVEQILERRESQLADKQRKDAAQRRKAVSNKLHTAAFTSMLDTLHGLLASSTEFPDLSKKFQVLEADLAMQHRRIKEENQDMINILFAHIPSNFVDANLSHIAAKLDPPQEESSAPVVEGEASSSSAAEDKPTTAAAPAKKLSKKEQIAAEKAAKEAEVERKKQLEQEAEVARKAAEQSRREKQEKLAALQAEQKRKQTIANPFTHLEAFSEAAAAELEKDQDAAKEHAIKRAAEAKVKQEQDRLVDAARAAAEKAEEAKAKASKVSASANAEAKVKAAEDARKAAQKAADDAKKAATKATQKEAEEKKRVAAERAAAEKAVAEKKKAEKAERQAAHQAAEKAAAERKKAAAAAAASSSSPAAAAAASSSSPSAADKAAADKKSSGRDRSEKQRKAEQIEAKSLEKQRKGQMSQIAASKKGSDNTNTYIAIGAGGVIALVVIYMIYSQFAAAAL